MKVVLVAKNTFRESVRDRVLYNLIVFALLLIASSIVLVQISIGSEKKIIVDLGLSAMRFFGMLIAIFIGIQLVYKEIERRTIYSLLSKPLRRSHLVLGKFLGLGLTLATNSAIMLVGIVLTLLLLQGGYTPQIGALLPAAYLIFLELLVTTAIALAFSTYSSPMLAALFTFLIYVAGAFSPTLKEVAANSDNPGLSGLFYGLYYAMPNLSTFNTIGPAAYGIAPTLNHVVSATVYAATYCAIALSLGVLVFEKKDFK